MAASDECRCSTRDLHLDALEVLVFATVCGDTTRFISHNEEHARLVFAQAERIAGRLA